MNFVRRLLLVLLCLVFALNGAALAHAGVASGHAHAAQAATVAAAVTDGAGHDAASTCHEAPDPATAGTSPVDASDTSCCDAAACDHACVPAATALVPERLAPGAERFSTAVPAPAMQPRGPPPAHPPIRPPIA